MKNIIIGPAYPYRGGIANFGESLCIAFKKKGIDSSIYTFKLQYPKFLFPGKTQYSNSEAPKDIKITRSINSVNLLSWIDTANRIKAEKPDYIIINYWMPFMAPALGYIARRIQKDTDIKVIAITHNIIPHEKRIGDRQLTNYFIKSCDGFITLARSVLDDLKVFTQNPNAVFNPHPIYDIFGEKVSKHDAKKHLNLDQNGKYILFFGIIRKYKGLDLLLSAFNHNNLKKLNLKLIIAGEFYEKPDEYLKFISDNNLQDSIILHDRFIDEKDVKYYFCASDMIVQPYRSATQSGVTQIAYQFERPMLVTDVGGLSEIVPDQKVGYVCQPNAESISESILDFYIHSRETEFENNIIEERKRFSWEKMVENISILYNNIF